MSRVMVVGGGASGMMAAFGAAEAGHEVCLLEKNEKLGKKIYITGKGRCNFTNACDTEDFFQNMVTNPKFLYSAIYAFDNHRMMEFIKDHGTPVKVERGNRVFPVSDHASDVTKALHLALDETGVTVRLHTRVVSLLTEEHKVTGVKTEAGEELLCDAVILATGGLSYPSTGSTGDGHRMLKDAGCRMKECYPALVSFVSVDRDICKLQGLSLKNVTLTVSDEKKQYYKDFGEMLFTHFGVSGPLVLSASSKVTGLLAKKTLNCSVDLKPALSQKQLESRILREISDNPKKSFPYLVRQLLPQKMAELFCQRLSVDPGLCLSDLKKEDRDRLLCMLKDFTFAINGTGGFKEAVITQGGLDVKEVNPSTMELKQIKGLYVCGELLDVDALTGGYNLQIAFSTGYLAGSSI